MYGEFKEYITIIAHFALYGSAFCVEHYVLIIAMRVNYFKQSSYNNHMVQRKHLVAKIQLEKPNKFKPTICTHYGTSYQIFMFPSILLSYLCLCFSL